MKRAALYLVAAACLLPACGDEGDSASITPIAAGEECPFGGHELVVNGERTAYCNGSANNVSVEHIPAGTEGSPCAEDAVRITTLVDGEELISWSCEDFGTPRANSEELALEIVKYEAVRSTFLGNAVVCANLASEGPESEAYTRAVEDQTNQLNEAMETLESVMPCANDHWAMAALPQVSEAVLEALECSSNYVRSGNCMFDRMIDEPVGVCGDALVSLGEACGADPSDKELNPCVAELTDEQFIEFAAYEEIINGLSRLVIALCFQY